MQWSDLFLKKGDENPLDWFKNTDLSKLTKDLFDVSTSIYSPNQFPSFNGEK